jgi:hypothetical protein
MAAAAGSLVVSLGLDAAEYTRGLTKAEYQARQFGEKIGSAIRDGASLAVASLATIATSSVAAFSAFDTLVKQVGDFQDLAEVTGASAEGLASFGVAAGTAGTSVEAIAQASVKLTKNLTGVDDESKAAGAALAALGLNLKDFKALAPEAQIEAISKALGGFQDGASKTAVATALLGKSGAELLPFLKALEEQGGRQVILTAEQIKQADEYADRQAKAKAELQQYAQALATQALPAVTAFINVLSEAAKELVSVGTESTKLGTNNGVATFAEDAIANLAFVVDAAQGVKVVFSRLGEFIGASVAAAQAKLTGDTQGLEAIRKAYDDSLQTTQFSSLQDKYRQALADQKAFRAQAARENRGFTPGQQALNFNGPTTKGGGGAKDDPTKKLLDNNLKALQNAAKEEEDLLRSRNRMLDLYNSENLISTQAYFEGKRVAQSAAVSSQIALYDQEIAALQKYQASAGKQTDREAAQGKINDLIEKKKRLTREAGETAIEWGFKERKALDDLAKQMNSVNAEVLELTGNLSAATRIRLEDQFGDISKRLGANGDTAGLAQIERLKQLKQAQADYGQQSETVSRITESLRIEEERITLARQLGTTGELESLAKLGESRKAAVAQLQSIVAAQEAIAQASGNPALVQSAERARLELEKLAATVDPLADKFNTLFADAAGSAFSDFINGTKTAKEAFKSFTDTIFKELTNLIVKDLFKQLFSGGGTGTGGVGFDFGSLLSGLFGGGKAAGGSVAPFGMHRVNEQGPELLDVNGKQYLMNGSRNARITPNSKLGGGVNYSPTFILDQPQSRSTQEQLSAVAYRGARRAMERTS